MGTSNYINIESAYNKIVEPIKKNKLSDFFGILSEDEAKELIRSIKKGRSLSRRRAKRLQLMGL